MCKQCGSLDEYVVTNVGLMELWKCADCGKNELRRTQFARGSVWRKRVETVVVFASGEIDDQEGGES